MIAFLLALAAFQPGATQRSHVGPAVVCGEAFALRIGRGERATSFDPGIDFFTYRVEGADGGFVLYEGNAPQPHDDELLTGLPWPSVIAIHDNRGAAAKARSRIRDRLVTGRARMALCPPRVPPPPPRR
jgi:hypothetical protein